MGPPLAGDIRDQHEIEGAAETADEEQSPDQTQKSGQRPLTPSEGDGLDLLDTILNVLTRNIRVVALVIRVDSTSSGLLVVVRTNFADDLRSLMDLLLVRSQCPGNMGVILTGETLADLCQG